MSAGPGVSACATDI